MKSHVCEYCGATYDKPIFTRGRNRICPTCFKIQEKLMHHLNSINAIIGMYRCRAAAGFKVPVYIEKYDKLMTITGGSQDE